LEGVTLSEEVKDLFCKKCKGPRVITSIGETRRYDGFRRKGFRDLIKTTEKLIRKKEKQGKTEEVESLKLALQIYQDGLERGRCKVVMHCPEHPKIVEKDVIPFNIEYSAKQFKDHLLLCGKCASKVKVTGTTAKGEFTILTVSCADHGEGERNIFTPIYESLFDIQPSTPATPKPKPAASTPKPKPAAPKPKPKPKSKPKPKPAAPTPTPTPVATTRTTKPLPIRFCRYCGAKRLTAESKYCNKCGQAIQ
jgi:hypothetical protein